MGIPDVSIVITIHNNRDILNTCLGCLAQQDFAGTSEVIICDDGSQEDILATVRNAFAGTLSDVRYIWQPRHGERRARSRNNGLRAAQGHIVLLVDGDFLVGRDFLRRHMEAHGAYSDCRTAVYGSRKWVFISGVHALACAQTYLQRLTDEPTYTARLYTDFHFQDKYANTGYQWLGCLACNFSFVRRPGILFDETFVGWGAEDQEFACRLQVRHGYQLLFKPDLWGLHCENASSTNFCPFRPKEHDDIVLYIRNVLHFRSAYPELDMLPACRGLGYLSLNSETARWERSSQPCFEASHLRHMLKVAEASVYTGQVIV